MQSKLHQPFFIPYRSIHCRRFPLQRCRCCSSSAPIPFDLELSGLLSRPAVLPSVGRAFPPYRVLVVRCLQDVRSACSLLTDCSKGSIISLFKDFELNPKIVFITLPIGSFFLLVKSFSGFRQYSPGAWQTVLMHLFNVALILLI